MAKTNKKKAVKKTTTKKNTNRISKLFEAHNIKDCRVVLNKIITRNIDIKLTSTSLSFNGKNIKPSKSNASSVTFQLEFNPKINDLIVQHCNIIDKDKVVKFNKPKSLASESNDKWRHVLRIHKERKIELQINQCVLAKMKSYAPWPSQIRSFSKNGKRAEVYFFGTENIGSVDTNQMIQLGDAADVIRLQLLRRTPFYSRAVLQMERICDVPDELSLLHELAAIAN